MNITIHINQISHSNINDKSYTVAPKPNIFQLTLKLNMVMYQDKIISICSYTHIRMADKWDIMTWVVNTQTHICIDIDWPGGVI